MAETLHWIEGARPKTLTASLSPALLGFALAYKAGHFSFFITLCILISAVSLQIGSNLMNDYMDGLRGADGPSRKGPRRLMASGLVSIIEMQRALWIVFSISMLFAIPLILAGGWPVALAMSLGLILSIAYSAGPYPLSYLGLGDLAVFLLFGPLATAFTFYLETGNFNSFSVIAGIGPGMLSAAILMVNNIRDIEEDKICLKKTIPVRLGKKAGQFLYLFYFSTASWVPLIFIKEKPFMFLPALILIPAFPLIQKIIHFKNSSELNPVLSKTGQLLLLYCILFSIGWIL